MFKRLMILIILLLPYKAMAITELSGQFGHQKQVYGNTRTNDIVTRTYMGSLAFYFLTYTAIEFNYSRQETIDTDRDSNTDISGTNFKIVGSQSRITTYSYGVGLKQALAGRKATWRPTISVGYARQFSRSSNDYTLQNKITNERTIITENPSVQRYDSVFGTFALQLRLTQTLSLQASVHTIFKAFEFNRAGDNIKYLAGFTWYF